jgi:hypothetical protein
MADDPKTRAEEMEEAYDSYVAKYGAENYNQIFSAVLKDISVSLGMIADNTAPADSAEA